MLDLNHLREQYAQHLLKNVMSPHSMDSALMHVAKLAYFQGARDERVKNVIAAPLNWQLEGIAEPETSALRVNKPSTDEEVINWTIEDL